MALTIQATMRMFDFQEKIVVVIGGETGIGRATVEAFARAGAMVVIAGFLGDEGQTVVDAMAAEGKAVEFVKTNVQNEAMIEAVVVEILKRHRRIDVHVSNDSVFDGFAGINETTTSLWEKVINTNLKGALLMSRAVLGQDRMARGQGNIINMASVGGLIGGADPDIAFLPGQAKH